MNWVNIKSGMKGSLDGIFLSILFMNSFHKFMIRLNEVYKTYFRIYEQDYGMDGFEWLVVDDRAQSVFAIERKGTDGSSLIAVMNFTGNKHEGYMVPVNQQKIKKF